MYFQFKFPGIQHHSSLICFQLLLKSSRFTVERWYLTKWLLFTKEWKQEFLKTVVTISNSNSPERIAKMALLVLCQSSCRCLIFWTHSKANLYQLSILLFVYFAKYLQGKKYFRLLTDCHGDHAFLIVESSQLSKKKKKTPYFGLGKTSKGWHYKK